MSNYRIFCILLALGAFSHSVAAQQGDGTDVPISTYIFKPNLVEATPERIATLKVPDGFKVKPFASGLKNARIIAVSDAGFVYVSRRDQGDVVLLKDADDDGQADEGAQIVATLPGTHGLAIKGHQLFL